MKIISKVLFAAILFATSACQAQPVGRVIENDLVREGLRGDVKTMTSIEYDFEKNKRGKVKKEWEGHVRKSYNRQGYMVEECRFDEDGGIDLKITMERDSLGVALERQLRFNWNGDLTGKVIYSYDDNGNLAELVVYGYGAEILTDRKIYAYDNKGNRVEEKHQILLNGSVSSEFLEKDEYKDGFVSKRTRYMDGERVVEIDLKYNAAGENDEQICYDGDGEFNWRLVSRYNEQGDVYEWIRYSESGKVTSEGEARYEYDSRGNATRIQSYQNGELISEEMREIEYY